MNNNKPSSESSHSPTEQPGDAKHTPGPWTYAYNGFGSHVVYSTDGSGTRICEMQQGPLQYNSELIARAPALLSEVSTLRSKQAELVAENERMKQRGDNHLAAFNRKVDECDALQSENARLREALEVIIKLDCLSHGLHDAEEIAKAALTTTPKP